MDFETRADQAKSIKTMLVMLELSDLILEADNLGDDNQEILGKVLDVGEIQNIFG